MDAPVWEVTVWEVTVWEVTVWEVTVFTKNRERLLEGDIAGGFLRAIRLDPAVKRLLSTERFSVAGTLIEAWASRKSFRGHLLMENRSGLVVDTETTHATGTAGREAAEAMVGDVPGCGRITLGSCPQEPVARQVADHRDGTAGHRPRGHA
jgi:hypothetical protein